MCILCCNCVNLSKHVYDFVIISVSVVSDFCGVPLAPATSTISGLCSNPLL